MTKKSKNEIEKLRDELNEMKQDGLLSNPSPSFTEKLNTKIRQGIVKYYKKKLAKQNIWYSSMFRQNYLQSKKALLQRNVGIKGYKINDLNSLFASAYKFRLQSSLALIKTQNDENMAKLTNRFLNWVTAADFNNKESLQEATKIPSSKKTRFILRDQSNKMSAALDDIVAQHYRAIAFEWMTRNDNRVSGKPSGLYPKVDDESTKHGDHWSRKGKFYYYTNAPLRSKRKLNLKAFAGSDKSLKDGMPGTPIGCRCWAKNYYDIEDLPQELLKDNYKS